MGVWSAAIYGSDTACDIKDDFFVRYNRGEDTQSITKEILEQFGDEEKCDIEKRETHTKEKSISQSERIFSIFILDN